MTTTTTSQPATDPRLIEELAEEYAALAADIEPKQARLEELKKQFRALQRGTHDIGGLAITVSRNVRLNTKALAEAYPEASNPELYVTKIDTAAVREHLDPDMVEDFSSESEPKVSVKQA